MLCIDTFTNYDVVVPVKSKIEDDIAAGILACMHKMGNKPEIIYTDHEGRYINHQYTHSLNHIK